MDKISRKGERKNELDGFIELGMRREALRLARQVLKGEKILAEDFEDSLRAILVFADKVKSWIPLVEAAYGRLSKRNQKTVRHFMLGIYHSAKKYEIASRFIPTRFCGKWAFSELKLSMETLLALGKMEHLDKLAQPVARTIPSVDDLSMRAMLIDLLAQYLARKGDSMAAIKLWKIVEQAEDVSSSAVIGTAEIHVARALRTIQRGLRFTDSIRGKFDPRMETILPGNDKSLLESAAKKYRKIEKVLEKIVPKKRQMELRIDRDI